MTYAAGYGAALLLFGVLDAIWLSIMGPALYRPTLGDILLPSLRIAPAIVFYLGFPVGIVVFAAWPGLRADQLSTTLGLGALFGAIAYGTYDLTNYATLRNWTLQITVLDIVYGAVMSALAAAVAFYAMRAVANWSGHAA